MLKSNHKTKVGLDKLEFTSVTNDFFQIMGESTLL